MRKTILMLFVVLMFPSVFASNPPTSGTIVSENSVDCGTKGKKTKTDLVCQEYVVRTATTEYHIRQEKQKDQSLLPMNSTIQFTMDKDKMKFKLNGSSYQFLVVSEAAVSAAGK